MNNSSVCVDANIVVQLVLGGAQAASITANWAAWRQAERAIVAPTLLFYEVSNVLHRYVVHGELLVEEATELFEAILALKINVYGDAALHRQAVILARRFAFPATYDAHYLALAERLGADFWTVDRRLARAVQPNLPWVYLVE